MRNYLLFFCLILFLPAYGQLLEQYHVQPINNLDALPGKQISCVYQDNDGYMWFGTMEGLCRYDGYAVKTYQSSYQAPFLLCNNAITAIAEDKNEQLWIGTIRGLNIFDKKSGKILPVELPSSTETYIRTLLYTNKQQLWIGAEDGLYLYDDESGIFTHFTHDETDIHTLNGNQIRALCEGSDGNIWIGIWDKGLCKINTETYQVTRYPEVCFRNRISAVFEDKDHNLWLGAWADGFFRVLNQDDPQATTYQRMDKESQYERLIHSIIQEEDGNILIGTGLGLDLISFSAGRPSYHSSDNQAIINTPNSEINNLYIGTNGIIWIATQGNGVYQLFKEKVLFSNHLYDTLGDLQQPASINTFFEWGDDILVGIDKIGIARYNKKTQQIVSCQYDPDLNKIPFPMGNIKCMMMHSSKNELYLGSEYGGLFICQIQNDRIVSARQVYYPWTSDSILGDVVSSICCDSEENIWIGTNGGLNIITADGDTLGYRSRDIGINFDIQTMIRDHTGRIWIGTRNNGIIQVQNTKGIRNLTFREYSIKNKGINFDEIKCLYQDKKRRLWAGTKGGGLCLYNETDDRFERVKAINEFSGNAILSIVESDDYLYLGTHQGLLQYNPDGEEDNQLIVLTESDGLLANTFNHNAAMKGKDGILYFGTPRGFTSFDPKQIEIEKEKGILVISDIKIFHNSYDNLTEEHQRRISPDSHPDFGKKIILSHKDYNFGLEFATLSYKHPDKNRYAYKLEGFDKEWNYVDSDNRSAYYTNMKSGTYRFMVKGTNENSFMNPATEIIEIKVLSPPYRTWWAYTLYIIAGILLLVAIARYFILRSRARMEKLEHQKREELAQEKLMFFTNISHELLTPLAIINCSVEELQRKYNDYGHTWKAVKGNIFRLNRLLEQILEFRKAEKGKLKLSVGYGDIATFIISICKDNFEHFESDKHIELSYHSYPLHIPAWFDKNAIDMIMYNLLSNAFKYNRPNGRVSVTITAEEQVSEYEYRYATITVGNTGEGFSQEQLNDLFKRFQSYKYTGREKRGNGIGLYLTKSLTELHKGDIQVNSRQGEWTEFVVKIPVSQSFYSVETITEEEAASKPLPYLNGEKPTLPPSPAPNGKTNYSILLIEDDKELLASMTNLLSDMFHIIQAKEGITGLELAKENNPDIIISDVMLPGLNGFEICNRIKEDITICHIPVVLLTAKVTNEDKLEGFRMGADAYITKPFNFELLLAQLNSLLSNREKLAGKFRQTPSIPDTLQMHTETDQRFMQEAVSIVEKNVSNPDFDLSLFLSEMKISNSMLYRKLKALTGLSPNEFIRNIRLKAACKLLLEDKHTIAEIAYRVGFNDAKYFSSCFKKEFNKTPSEYITEYVNKKNTSGIQSQ